MADGIGNRWWTILACPSFGRATELALASATTSASADRGHGGDEPVPSTRNRFDERLVAVLAECLPHCEHVIREVALFDERVGPDFSEELVFGDDPACPGGERQQDVERLGRQRHRPAAAQQHTLGHVEREVAKLQTGGSIHGGGVAPSIGRSSYLRTTLGAAAQRSKGPQIQPQSQIKPR
jgi:hypothetical protein